jgi:phospho-N-acetylmuramoyl-pentapeptide-transferase
MIQLLGLVLISFLLTSFLLVPFIDLLFYLKKRRSQRGLSDKSREAFDVDTPIHNKLLEGKDLDVPIGGGILLIAILVVLSLIYKNVFHIRHAGELYILLFTVCIFGFIGFLDDIRKIFVSFSGKFKGIQARYLLILQIIFAALVSGLLYFGIGLNNIYLPVVGNIILGVWYIPLAIFTIVGFANAYNISDGLDGLSSGLLLICLIAFLVLVSSVLNLPLSVFIGIWIGTLIAYLYFNVFPARIYLGDAGAFGFGATLAVVGLLTGKIIGLAIIGAMYIIIVGSSLFQLLSKKVLKRKLFPVAPIHMYFKYIGWEEPKIVMRFWLAGAIFAVFGLWLAFLSR